MSGEDGTLNDNAADDHNSTTASTRLFKERWLVLSIFCLLSMTNAFQWIQFSIITNILTRFYDVSEIAINWTSMIYMLTYVPLVFPANWLLDAYGLRTSALLGASGNCLGAMIKCLSAAPELFWVAFIGQTISGISQIFTLCLPSRIAAIWFGPREVSTATSIGVFGNQLGIALGFLIPPIIVRSLPCLNQKDLACNETLAASNETHLLTLVNSSRDTVARDLQILFCAVALVALLVFILTVVLFSAKPKVPPSYAQLRAINNAIERNYVQSLKHLCSDRNFIILLISYGINTGAFYAVSTLLNQVLLIYFPGEEVNIGRAGLTIVLAGLLGSLVCGFILDRTKAYKTTTVVVYALSFVGMLLYTITIQIKLLWLVFIISALLGFFMTGYLPVGFEFASELTYPISEGTSSGLLNCSAQIFGIIMTFSMGLLVINVSERACNICLTVCLAIGLAITILIKPELRRHSAERNSLAKKASNQDKMTK